MFADSTWSETGRAGRDGHTSRCLMYYSAEDKARVQSLVAMTLGARQRRFEQDNGPSPSQRSPKSIEALIAFAETASQCRHISICRYFGERVSLQDAPELCSNYCDVCKNPAKVRKSRDDGLIELDFPATQAVLQSRGSEVEDEDPFADERGEHDYEPDRTQVPRRRRGGLGGIEEEGSEADEEDDADDPPIPTVVNPRREGFRTAAVQRDRDRNKAMRTAEEEPESSPLPEMGGGDLPAIPTQEASSDIEVDDVPLPVQAVDSTGPPPVAGAGPAAETPLGSDAPLPPSAQRSKHIEPPPCEASEMEVASEFAVVDGVEAVSAAAPIELDGEEPGGADQPAEVEKVVEAVEAVETSSDLEDEKPVAKRPMRLSHVPLFAPDDDDDDSDDDDEDNPHKTLEIAPAPISKLPPRDARKEVGVPFKQRATAHKAGPMRVCEWLIPMVSVKVLCTDLNLSAMFLDSARHEFGETCSAGRSADRAFRSVSYVNSYGLPDMTSVLEKG